MHSRTDSYWRPSRRQAECMLFVAWNDRPRSYHNRNIHGPLQSDDEPLGWKYWFSLTVVVGCLLYGVYLWMGG